MTEAMRNRPAGTMNGGRALAEMLRLAGAGPMFGMGGFQLLPFYDAIGLVGLKHHLINDERCGAFAADGLVGGFIPIITFVVAMLALSYALIREPRGYAASASR